MKYSVIILLLVLGCAPGSETQPRAPHHITIALDLSDRLRNENQKDNDLRVISLIGESFHALVKSQLYIASRDRLSVVLIRQTTNPDTHNLTDVLTVDISTIALDKRRHEVEARIEQLIEAVDSLYTAAIKHNTFTGADVSGFIAEDLYVPQKTLDGVPIKHTLIILSDGYIIDEHNLFRKGKGANYITKEALTLARASPSPPNDSFYLIPVRDDLAHVGILVLELDPHPGLFGELNTLRRFWSAWFDSMNVGYYEIHKTTDNTATSRDVITRFLNH